MSLSVDIICAIISLKTDVDMFNVQYTNMLSEMIKMINIDYCLI